MKNITLLLLSIGLLIQANAQIPDTIRRFIDSALNIMQQRSVFSENVNWTKVRDSVVQLSINARTYADAQPANKYAFNSLHDKHGWLVFDNVDYHNPFFPPDTTRIAAGIKHAFTKPATVYSGVVDKYYAYISIPFFGGQTGEKMNAFAQMIQDSLCQVISPATKGLIIDLRLNGGGNLFPMVIGISNIIGDGKLTESVDSRGHTEGAFVIKNGSVTIVDTIVVKLKKACDDFTKLPVAVLIGPATGSSGEQLAIILSMRKNTVLIGEPTAGYTTGNNGFLLPGINNGIVIGESYTRDGNGKIYKDAVDPEIEVIGGDAIFDRDRDKKIQAAIAWLKKQHRPG